MKSYPMTIPKSRQFIRSSVPVDDIPDSKVHGAYMGPTWGRQDPGGPHVGPMNLASRDQQVADLQVSWCHALMIGYGYGIPNNGHQVLYPDNKVHGANMGPTWDRQDPGGPHVGPMNLASRDQQVADLQVSWCHALMIGYGYGIPNNGH